jgi:hypothetical protein
VSFPLRLTLHRLQQLNANLGTAGAANTHDQALWRYLRGHFHCLSCTMGRLNLNLNPKRLMVSRAPEARK